MVVSKPRIVIIGAGLAGLTAANKLYKANGGNSFEVCIVEGGNRIGGRINTSEFGGDRVELGATWIHGIGGSPVYELAQELDALESNEPWECMDGFLDDTITIAENGYVLSLFFKHCGHRDKVVDFHWNVYDPWTIVSVSDDVETTSGGGTLQV
uniref:Probable polyamine oxidase 5 n=1 Tax=Tanacetum cinerariifolium TaxID=118510 RepID=A0A6L2ME81_TANCI|nr:probable polyamine oxidase 5 [Tanacetum cinerariifolium]